MPSAAVLDAISQVTDNMGQTQVAMLKTAEELTSNYGAALNTDMGQASGEYTDAVEKADGWANRATGFSLWTSLGVSVLGGAVSILSDNPTIVKYAQQVASSAQMGQMGTEAICSGVSAKFHAQAGDKQAQVTFDEAAQSQLTRTGGGIGNASQNISKTMAAIAKALVSAIVNVGAGERAAAKLGG